MTDAAGRPATTHQEGHMNNDEKLAREFVWGHAEHDCLTCSYRIGKLTALLARVRAEATEDETHRMLADEVPDIIAGEYGRGRMERDAEWVRVVREVRKAAHFTDACDEILRRMGVSDAG